MEQLGTQWMDFHEILHFSTFRTGNITIWCMRFACWITKPTDTHSEYELNNCCFSTATRVTRTRLGVTWYLHCLSCLYWCFSCYFNLQTYTLGLYFRLDRCNEYPLYSWGGDSSVCTVAKVLRSSILWRRNIFFFSAKCADLLSGPTNLRFNAYRGFFPRRKAAGDMKLATYVDLEPSLRIGGSIPLPHGLLQRVKVQLYLQPCIFYPPSTTTTCSSFLRRHWVRQNGDRHQSLYSNWCPLYGAQSRVNARFALLSSCRRSGRVTGRYAAFQLWALSPFSWTFFYLPFNQQSEYKVFYKLMYWLAGSLTCRLPNVVRSPPARRSRKFSHHWLMFGSSFTRFLQNIPTHHRR